MQSHFRFYQASFCTALRIQAMATPYSCIFWLKGELQCLAGPLLHRWQDQQNPGDEPKGFAAPDRNQTALVQHLAWGLGGTNHPEGKSSVGQCHRNLPGHLSKVPSRADLQSFARLDSKSAQRKLWAIGEGCHVLVTTRCSRLKCSKAGC